MNSWHLERQARHEQWSRQAIGEANIDMLLRFSKQPAATPPH